MAKKKTGMLVELLGAALCMSLALAIAVPCLWSAHVKSEEAYARDLAVPVAETMAAAAAEHHGDAELVAQAVGGDAYGHVAVAHIEEVPGCTVAYLEGKPGAGLGKGEVRAYAPDGTELFSFPATWQEELVQDGDGEA